MEKKRKAQQRTRQRADNTKKKEECIDWMLLGTALYRFTPLGAPLIGERAGDGRGKAEGREWVTKKSNLKAKLDGGNRAGYK